ncbi:MAG: hypothetical protein JNK82_39360 [Myxococcaceae bacterium]|nr:hypothetical protein [Myxococcaceae bacterium]
MATLTRRLQLNAFPVNPSLGGVARATSALLGTWLVFSSFVFNDPLKFQLSGWGAGIAIAVLAINSFWFPAVRFVNTLIALWVAASYFVMDGPRGPGMVNTLIVGFFVFFVSLIPNATRVSPERPSRKATTAS